MCKTESNSNTALRESPGASCKNSATANIIRRIETHVTSQKKKDNMLAKNYLLVKVAIRPK